MQDAEGCHGTPEAEERPISCAATHNTEFEISSDCPNFANLDELLSNSVIEINCQLILIKAPPLQIRILNQMQSMRNHENPALHFGLAPGALYHATSHLSFPAYLYYYFCCITFLRGFCSFVH